MSIKLCLPAPLALLFAVLMVTTGTGRAQMPALPTDVPMAISAIQTRATACLGKLPASPLRARHEGMVLYLCGLLRGMATAPAPPADFAARYMLLGKILDGLDAGVDVLAQQRGHFEWAYYAPEDGSGQPIMIDLPPDYDGHTPLPLVVALHGNGGSHEFYLPRDHAPAFIGVGVNGRGDPHYFGLGETDVLHVTDFLLANFPVDPQRVVLSGISTGGWGVLRIASRYPDKYAGVISYCAYAYGLDISNLSGMPVQIHHGGADWADPTDDMRITANELGKTSKLVSYFEYPGIGHDVFGSAQQNHPLEMLETAKSDPYPHELRYTTDQVTRGRCHWAAITRFIDPQAAGSIHFTVEGAAISGTTRNIAGLRLTNLAALCRGATKVKLRIDGHTLKLTPAAGDVCLAYRHHTWKIVPADVPKVTPYQRGGLMNIFDGQPIVIVAPSGWREDVEARELIEKCASHADFGRRPMPFGRIPVVDADTFDATSFNGHLVLVGNPATNRVLARLLPALPVHLAGEMARIDGVGQYPLATTAISLTYRNPYAPGYRVVWFQHETADICPYRPLLYTSYSFAVRADVIVHDRSGETPVFVAAANYGEDWQVPGRTDKVFLPKSISSTNTLEREAISTAMREMHADYGVYCAPAGHGDSPTLAGGHLSLSALQALIPAGMQTIVSAHLTRDQVLDMQLRTQGKSGVGWVAAAAHMPEKPFYTVVLIEPIFDTIGCELHYSFPLGSITRSGKDAHDILAALLATGK